MVARQVSLVIMEMARGGGTLFWSGAQTFLLWVRVWGLQLRRASFSLL